MKLDIGTLRNFPSQRKIVNKETLVRRITNLTYDLKIECSFVEDMKSMINDFLTKVSNEVQILSVKTQFAKYPSSELVNYLFSTQPNQPATTSPKQID